MRGTRRPGAVVAGFFLVVWAGTFSAHGSEPRPDFRLPDHTGVERSVSEWDDKVMVLNFWATWCSPCLKEIPEFIELQTEYGARGLQFVGIAIDDLDNVVRYMGEAGINYPILIGQMDAIELATRYGNRVGALPFTAVVDHGGPVVFSKAGALTLEEARSIIEPLL